MSTTYLTGSYSVFDVTGPIMVGPSSSHTAGAARLGKMARILAHNSVKKITFQLFGSFAQTYKGHGTDKALLAGVLGLDPWDLRLRDSFAIAEETGVEYTFQPITQPTPEGWEYHHPNTVRFLITASNGELFDIVGCSVGGGKVRIISLNGILVNFTGESPILVTRHNDSPGIIAGIASILYQEKINIGNMRVDRKRYSTTADLYLELDSDIDDSSVEKIKKVPGMISVILLRRIDEDHTLDGIE